MLHLDDLKPNECVNYTVLFNRPLTAFARQTQTGAEILPPRPCGGKKINRFAMLPMLFIVSVLSACVCVKIIGLFISFNGEQLLILLNYTNSF